MILELSRVEKGGTRKVGRAAAPGQGSGVFFKSTHNKGVYPHAPHTLIFIVFCVFVPECMFQHPIHTRALFG